MAIPAHPLRRHHPGRLERIKWTQNPSFFWPSLSTISADDYFDDIHRIISLLDEENITILRTMKEHGPRNLLGIARKALKIPGFWLRVARCIGDCNGYYSLHGIPTANRQEFELYLEQLLERGLLKNYRVFWIGDTKFPLTNFDYYKPKDRTWKFDWREWLNSFATSRAKPDSGKQSSQPVSFDKKDLIILKELVKNARTTLADLSKLLSLTLPAAKYRFDRLVERGLIQEWVIDLLPYAPQISELAEVRLDFKNENLMRGAESVLESLPIVQSYSPITGLNSMTTRLYLPRSEVSNLHTFLSLLVSKGVLTSYSYIVIDATTITAQTFAYKDYDDESGWKYTGREYLKAVDNMMPKWTKNEIELSYQALPSLSLKM